MANIMEWLRDRNISVIVHGREPGDSHVALHTHEQTQTHRAARELQVSLGCLGAIMTCCCASLAGGYLFITTGLPEMTPTSTATPRPIPSATIYYPFAAPTSVPNFVTLVPEATSIGPKCDVVHPGDTASGIAISEGKDINTVVSYISVSDGNPKMVPIAALDRVMPGDQICFPVAR